MKTQHTPDKWEIIRNEQPHGTVTKIMANTTIIATVNADGETTKDEFSANARLIAAAPELLEMVYNLKQCIKRLSQDGVSQEDRDKDAQWEGEAHELLLSINPDYYNNANQ